MTVKIGKRKHESYRNQFVIKTEWMHGDADADSTEIKVFERDQEELFAAYVRVWERMKKVHHLNDSDDIYKKLEEFATDEPLIHKEIQDFKAECPDESHKYICAEIFNVPGDSTCDHQFAASFEAIEVSFYDKIGNEFSVTVK